MARPAPTTFVPLIAQVEVTPDRSNPINNVRYMHDHVMRIVFTTMQDEARIVKNLAQKNAAWKDHANRHPSDRWPGPETARKQIESDVFKRGAHAVAVVLKHGVNTIMVTTRAGPTGTSDKPTKPSVPDPDRPKRSRKNAVRRVITYGGILESNYWGKYAILKPSIEERASTFDSLMEGAMSQIVGGFKGAKFNKSTGGRPKKSKR